VVGQRHAGDSPLSRNGERRTTVDANKTNPIEVLFRALERAAHAEAMLSDVAGRDRLRRDPKAALQELVGEAV